MRRWTRKKPRSALGSVLIAGLLAAALPTSSARSQVGLGLGRILFVNATSSETQNCGNLRQVLDGLSDPSVSNLYLIRLPAGRFNCGTVPLVVPDGVTIEGSGASTLILGEPAANSAAVSLGDRSGLRSLVVFIVTDETSAAAVQLFSLEQPLVAHLFDVRIDSSGAGGLGARVSGPGGTFLGLDYSRVFGRTAAVVISAGAQLWATFSSLHCQTAPCVLGPGTTTCTAAYRGTSELPSNCR